MNLELISRMGSGQELDIETGLYNYGARYYDPKISLFFGVDPMAGLFPNHSPYTYTFNNPVRYTDPSGMSPEGEPEGDPPVNGGNVSPNHEVTIIAKRPHKSVPTKQDNLQSIDLQLPTGQENRPSETNGFWTFGNGSFSGWSLEPRSITGNTGTGESIGEHPFPGHTDGTTFGDGGTIGNFGISIWNFLFGAEATSSAIIPPDVKQRLKMKYDDIYFTRKYLTEPADGKDIDTVQDGYIRYTNGQIDSIIPILYIRSVTKSGFSKMLIE